MASQPPDLRTLNSWEDAFQYPLPVVRKLEQQLRTNIDESRQKLRSLVGASYRDLLGTAERIVEMDEQMHTVERNLSDIGRKCNARAVERVAENQARMRKAQDARHVAKYRAVAQTKVLQSTLSVISRTIKSGGDSLLAAKLLVMARLLHKSVAEGSEAPDVLEDLRRRLTVLRKRLLSYVERSLVKPVVDRSVMINPLCAYAMVTSSAPRDVLRHFLQARYQQLEIRSEDTTPENVNEMLEMYSQTLLDTRDLFPRRFTDGLSRIGKLPLLQDSQLRSTHELSLDIYDQHFAEDIRTFTPWLRHDQLTTSEVAEGLSHWSEQAQKCLQQALEDCLGAQTDAHAILKIRHEVLSKYLTLNSRVRDSADPKAIRDAREAFLARLAHLAAAATDVKDFKAIDLERPSAPLSGGPSWRLATEDIELSGGATHFRHAVLQQRHGLDEHLLSIIASLDTWLESVKRFWEVIDEMRATKWIDDLDDDDVEDMFDGETAQTALSRRDPDLLRTKLREATSTALRELYSKVYQSSTSKGAATSLLRILRELDQRRHGLGDQAELSDVDLDSGKVISEMHRNIASNVLEAPLLQHAASAKRRSAFAVTVWDGTPALPIQPSPRAFRLLTSLHKAMSNAGSDLWSSAAVSVLKDVLAEEFGKRLILQDGDKPVLNGHTETADDQLNENPKEVNGSSDVTHDDSDRVTQMLFDTLYLQRVTSGAPKNTENDALDGAIDAMRQRLVIDDAGYQRMQKSANEYWKRTYLLFGLLAPDNNMNE